MPQNHWSVHSELKYCAESIKLFIMCAAAQWPLFLSLYLSPTLFHFMFVCIIVHSWLLRRFCSKQTLRQYFKTNQMNGRRNCFLEAKMWVWIIVPKREHIKDHRTLLMDANKPRGNSSILLDYLILFIGNSWEKHVNRPVSKCITQ